MLLRGLIPSVVVAVLLRGTLPPALAEEPLNGAALIQDFTSQPETREPFFTDQLVGGRLDRPHALRRLVSPPPDVGRWRVNDGW